ncbi:hypothetical protein FHX37_1202 [Haloactinospora alba]|uniref:Uncharacterized protein n=1 Tax=Haloactinospora alba TaxID=405555 RepID=A0A543NHH9_9ACTN|nr:hypothetical protein [Haloactinospora alba]TQN31302.1 hypothetical protein FHX37_1202 [Haloactinospora alba]
MTNAENGDADAPGLAERTLRSARERLAALDELPTSDHVAVFDELHRELSGVLGVLDRDADTGTAPPAGSGGVSGNDNGG